jgi:adenylate cyclase
LVDNRVERRLAAVLAADVAGYSRLMGTDEVGTLEALKAHRREVVDPAIAFHKGRIVKTTGDGMLVEFGSAVDAVTCAVAMQEKMAERNDSFMPKITFRIGINIGDLIIEGDDIFGDGVNVAARVENECEPGGVCLSGSAFEQIRGKTAITFDDLGERSLKNIDRPVRLYAARTAASPVLSSKPSESAKPLALPDKPSIAVLPFQNMSGDPEQEYFADGMVEEIITALSRNKQLFVIARNSSFTFKGRAVDIKQVGRELGVRYVLEGSVRKAGGRVRITGQLIEAATGAHLWADRYDGALEDVFDLQDRVASSVVGAIAPSLDLAEMERAQRKPSSSLNAYDLLTEAVRLDPSNISGWLWAGWAKVYLGDHRTAIDHFHRALRLSPMEHRMYDTQAGLAYAHFFLGNYQEGLQCAAKVLRYHPEHLPVLRAKMACLALSANLEEARKVWRQVALLSPTDRVSETRLRAAYNERDLIKIQEAYRLAGMPE